MNQPHENENWIERAQALLDESADNLDAATLSRLNRARQAALAQRRGVPRRWAWSAALAGAAVALFGVAVGLHHRFDAPGIGTPTTVPLQAGDIDFLTSDDDALDLYENLDFYAWLEKQNGDPRG
jgi:ferric-dicitrate binding protein FerR (iron transport regulator)